MKVQSNAFSISNYMSLVSESYMVMASKSYIKLVNSQKHLREQLFTLPDFITLIKRR